MNLNIEKKQLQKGLETLKELQEEIERKIEKREDTFDQRSEKWQDSEKGIEFQETTDQLQDFLDTLSAINDDIEDLTYSLEEIE